MVSALDLERFRTAGYTVLHDLLDADALSAEVDRALVEGDLGGAAVGDADIRFRYVPMMGGRTPVSLELVDAWPRWPRSSSAVRSLPVRAKAVRYVASAERHRDSTSHRAQRRLRHLPGAARRGHGRAARGARIPRARGGQPEQDEVALETEPGDLIVFDEHLLHGSSGGRDRRQWRVDFFVDPTSAEEEAAARAYLLATFPPDWDGGYDVDRFPSYGGHWRARDRPWHERLADLGAYAAAGGEEASAARSGSARRGLGAGP